MPFLTPDPPETLITLQAAIPDTLLPHFIGAWLELWKIAHWENFGALSQDLAVEYITEAFTTITEFPPLPGQLAGKTVKYLYVVVGGTLLYIKDESGNPLFIVGDL